MNVVNQYYMRHQWIWSVDLPKQCKYCGIYMKKMRLLKTFGRIITGYSTDLKEWTFDNPKCIKKT